MSDEPTGTKPPLPEPSVALGPGCEGERAAAPAIQEDLRALRAVVEGTPAGKARGAEVFRKFLAGEGASGWELEMRRKDGRPLWISLWMEPIRGEDGKVVASRSFWVDITDRVLAEAERARLQEQNNPRPPPQHPPKSNEKTRSHPFLSPHSVTVVIYGDVSPFHFWGVAFSASKRLPVGSPG